MLRVDLLQEGGVQAFGFPAPHWKNCPGSHLKYSNTSNIADELGKKKKKGSKHNFHGVLRKFTNLCWPAFEVILGPVWPWAAGWTSLL